MRIEDFRRLGTVCKETACGVETKIITAEAYKRALAFIKKHLE